MLPFILYDNIFDSSVTATDTDATGDYNPAYIQDLRDFTHWRAASLGTKYLTVDAGAAVPADTLAILAHNLGTAGATVSLEASATGAFGGEEVTIIAGFNPSDDLVIAKTFGSASYRHWRLKIVTAGIAPELAVCILGERMDFPIYPDTPFTPKTESVNATAPVSKGGHFLGVTSKYSPLSFPIKFTWPQMSFIDGDFKTFWETHGRALRPFFWVPNFTEWPDRVYFVRFPPRFKLAVPQSDMDNADSLTLAFEGHVE